LLLFFKKEVLSFRHEQYLFDVLINKNPSAPAQNSPGHDSGTPWWHWGFAGHTKLKEDVPFWKAGPKKCYPNH
jgi:hypothetical protein